LFPVDIDAAFSKITADFKLSDGSTRMMETKVAEREKIEVKYEDALSSGKTAVMGSFTKTQRDMVRINIGHFPHKSEAILRVYFYSKLEVEDLSYCLRIPMSYVPKYMGDMVEYLERGV
jgi:hypothetical protein